MAAAGVSPSSSPRLPSPPPFTEVQIGPKSPSVGESFGKDAEQLLGSGQAEDDGSLRRIRPGTKAADMASGPPLIPLSQLDSPFQLQEHLKALYNHYTKSEDSDTTVAINRDVATQLAEPPEGIDRPLWLYELCRFLTMKVNNLIIAFFAEVPPCTSQTCPEMRASEWQYLCAVHDPPKSCCAIDYCCHTLDWATNILTSPKYFPSRLTLGSASHGGPQASMRHLTNIFRRLYRIFAHAWFQHRDVFWQVEGHDGLYIFFKTVCDMYNLIPEDNYTIPAEAEGLEAQKGDENESKDGRRLTILRKDDDTSGPTPLFDDTDAPGATTRRHKHTPSTGSRVTTITESAEDTDDNQKPSLPEVKEEPGKKEAEEVPVKETGEPVETPLAMTTQETEAQEEAQKPSESEPQLSEPRPAEPEPADAQPSDAKSSEPQPSEFQPSETEKSESPEPAPQPSEQKEQTPSEEPVSESGPESTAEKAPANDQEQAQPTKAEDPKEEIPSTQESEAEKAATDETSATSSEPQPEPESKPTETKAEAETPKET